MGRIKIKDLPKDVEISKEEMKKMTGGGFVTYPSPLIYQISCQSCLACQMRSNCGLCESSQCDPGLISWDPGEKGF